MSTTMYFITLRLQYVFKFAYYVISESTFTDDYNDIINLYVRKV